jgi:hypothetical protein
MRMMKKGVTQVMKGLTLLVLQTLQRKRRKREVSISIYQNICVGRPFTQKTSSKYVLITMYIYYRQEKEGRQS